MTRGAWYLFETNHDSELNGLGKMPRLVEADSFDVFARRDPFNSFQTRLFAVFVCKAVWHVSVYDSYQFAQLGFLVHKNLYSKTEEVSREECRQELFYGLPGREEKQFATRQPRV